MYLKLVDCSDGPTTKWTYLLMAEQVTWVNLSDLPQTHILDRSWRLCGGSRNLDDYIHRTAGDHEWEFHASGTDMEGDNPKRDVCFDADLAWMFDGEERERLIGEMNA